MGWEVLDDDDHDINHRMMMSMMNDNVNDDDKICLQRHCDDKIVESVRERCKYFYIGGDD